MKKNRTLLWLIPLILLLLLIPFIVPSSLPAAGAEGIPEYQPVELANPDPGPITPVTETLNNGKTVEYNPYGPHPDAYVRDANGDAIGYLDGTLSVRVDVRTVQDNRVWFAWVQIADASQLRAAFARPYPSDALRTGSEMAKGERAVLALNGDYCTGIHGGVGTIFRNGKEYRRVDAERYDQLIIDINGNFHILKNAKSADFDAYEGCILHSFVFGPALVVDGELQDLGDARDYGYNMTFEKPARRQAICQMGPLSYLIVTTEGPEQHANGGFSLYDFARLVYDTGAVNAYNLDGGSSTWLVMDNKQIGIARNLRSIADIIYFVTAEPDPAENTADEGTLP